MYEVIFRNPAKRFLKIIDKISQKSILKKIEILKENPRIGKPLTGNLRGFWRLRYNKYRVIYKIKDQELIVYVMNIGNRGKIYNK